MQGSTPEAYSVLSGKVPFTDPGWERELGHLVNALVTAKSEPSYSSKPSHQEANAIATNVLQKIDKSRENRKSVHQAILCLLMLADVYPEVASVTNLEPVQQVLEMYPMDDFLQAGANRLLNLSEELISLKMDETKFEYPPFQKALPYFPSFGNQVTMVFEDGPTSTLTTEVQTKIIGLVHTLNGMVKHMHLYILY